MSQETSRIIYTGKVVDNQDTSILGRVRVFPEKDEDVTLVLQSSGVPLNSSGTDILDKYKFTKDDPFVFMPLMPYYIQIVPNINELVWVMYSDVKQNTDRKEQFYIPIIKADPFNFIKEDSSQTKVNTIQGTLLTQNKYKSDTPNNLGVKEPNEDIKGIFANPGDNAFYGKGSTDLILKENELILRSGKIANTTTNSVQEPNDKRGFYQISYYNKNNKKDPAVSRVTSEIDNSFLKKLIEYEIYNPENAADNFRGVVNIYNMPQDKKKGFINNEFTSQTVVDPSLTQTVFSYNFENLTLSQVAEVINKIINGLNNTTETNPLKISGETYPAKEFSIAQGEPIFPFYYRASPNLYKVVTKQKNFNIFSNLKAFTNVQTILSQVRFVFSTDLNGEGLVSNKDTFGISFVDKKIQVPGNEVYFEEKNSVSIAGSNKILLISYNTNPPSGKSKIELDKKTIYGIEQNMIFDTILPNTEPVVRGESLKNFLNLIVKFLTTHSHPFHQLPPTPISYSQVSVASIEQEFQNYDSKVVNQNIRVN